jgi:hypothetical protein
MRKNFTKLCISLAHKVRIYKEYHSVYVPSLELGLSHPHSRQRDAPPPRTKGRGAHSPAGEGLGESQFRRLEKSLALCLLCALAHGKETFVFQSFL